MPGRLWSGLRSASTLPYQPLVARGAEDLNDQLIPILSDQVIEPLPTSLPSMYSHLITYLPIWSASVSRNLSQLEMIMILIFNRNKILIILDQGVK